MNNLIHSTYTLARECIKKEIGVLDDLLYHNRSVLRIYAQTPNCEIQIAEYRKDIKKILRRMRKLSDASVHLRDLIAQNSKDE